MLSSFRNRPRGSAVIVAVGAGIGAIALASMWTDAADAAAAAGAGAKGGGPIVPQPATGREILGLDADEFARFDVGRVLFDEPLLPGDGLGPIFNREACGRCHGPLRGGGSEIVVTRFGRDDGGTFDPLTELGGGLLQDRAISEACREIIPEEANVTADRVVNGSFGYGLIEAIPDADILALEQDPPGVSGRAHMVEPLEDPGTMRVGRFGWKSQVATILTFSADAARNEMGLTSRLLPEDLDPNGTRPPLLGDCDSVDDPEDGPDGEGFHFIDRVTDFMRFLAAPPQTPREGMSGEAIFASIGCADCHHREFTTADDDMLEAALRNKVIRPYSDFLLHDMGAAAEDIPQGDAAASEIRTPPLWGVRLRQDLWHDGRFGDADLRANLVDAIEAHGAADSEAAVAAAAWDALGGPDQAAVLDFLNSLGRREFDADENDIIVLSDFAAFAACFFGPGNYGPDDPCALMDIDMDGEVDADDYASFLLAYIGPMDDCNDNMVSDLDDIISGTSVDENANGIPDECEACPGDADDNGVVDFRDVLVVLSDWGVCGGPGDPCDGDLDMNRVVDFRDILVILSDWGPC